MISSRIICAVPRSSSMPSGNVSADSSLQRAPRLVERADLVHESLARAQRQRRIGRKREAEAQTRLDREDDQLLLLAIDGGGDIVGLAAIGPRSAGRRPRITATSAACSSSLARKVQ